MIERRLSLEPHLAADKSSAECPSHQSRACRSVWTWFARLTVPQTQPPPPPQRTQPQVSRQESIRVRGRFLSCGLQTTLLGLALILGPFVRRAAAGARNAPTANPPKSSPDLSRCRTRRARARASYLCRTCPSVRSLARSYRPIIAAPHWRQLSRLVLGDESRNTSALAPSSTSALSAAAAAAAALS